jgi:hypothetical protein
MTTIAACNIGRSTANGKRSTTMSNATKPGVVNIRGKEYQTVALRVQMFREAHPEWTIMTELIHCDDTVVRMKATISRGAGISDGPAVIATGHAEEYRKSSEINKTSAVENCETSAIGRALAAAGFGGTEFASADELEKALRAKDANIGISATQVAVDAFSELPEETQSYLHREAIKITAMHERGENVGQYVARQAYDTESKLGLWSLLRSDVRSAIKKQATPQELASQS